MTPLYSENPAMFRSNPLGFILAVILIAAFGLGLIILLAWYMLSKASKLEVTDSEILYEEGLLSKERSEVNISSIRSIKVKQSFINRIFGVGSVELYTAGDAPEISVSGLPNPNKVRELVKLGQRSGG